MRRTRYRYKGKTYYRTAKETPVSYPAEKVSYSHDQLMKALYAMYDLFSRANMPFFLLDETAKCAKENKTMEGTHITLGIRVVDFQERSFGILEAFKKADRIGEKEIRYSIEGVPVVVRVINSLEPMFTNTDTFMYQYEFFSIPNPFDKYWANRHIYES